MDSMAKVTATEAARSFGELLSRVRDRGERFTVVCAGEEVAEIIPVAGSRGITLGALRATLASLPPPDDGFAADLERIRAGQPPAEPTWRS
jgi:prevent-host-death family protein